MALSPRQTATVSVLHPAPTDADVAVLLNANAKAINPRVVRAIASVVPARDFYLSKTFEDAGVIAREVVRRGYETVLTGGGDGTFVGFYNALRKAAARRQLGADSHSPNGAISEAAPLRMPRVGALRLGTGNAIAGYTGASCLRRAGVLDDILSARAGMLANTRSLDLVEVEGGFAPFAGVGLDALILNNYIRWKKLLGTSFLKFLGQGNCGYACSIAGLSVPEAFLRRPPEIEVVNTGDAAIPVDVDGSVCGRPVPSGAVIYRGPARIASVGTCPNYGFGFKIFPAADSRPGRMQLRVSDIGVPETLWNLPAIWRGYYRAPSIRDFMVTSVSITSERPMPFQIGGDAMGYRDQIDFSVAAQAAELIDFSRRALPAA